MLTCVVGMILPRCQDPSEKQKIVIFSHHASNVTCTNPKLAKIFVHLTV
uniref:Uncharacterized protein n=1 Tax=Rhizophora mucronata TaxID=61149 RepID=A0A2P2NPU8_RHIMU